MRILDAKAAVDKEWEKLGKLSRWQLNKVKSKKEVILDARKEKESPLCYLGGHLSSQKCGVRTEVPKVQRTNRTPEVTLRKTIRALICPDSRWFILLRSLNVVSHEETLIRSLNSGIDSLVHVTRKCSFFIWAICRPRRNRFCFWAFCSSKKTLFLLDRQRRGLKVEYRCCRSCNGGNRRDLMMSQATQVARSRLRSCATLSWMSYCPPCF